MQKNILFKFIPPTHTKDQNQLEPYWKFCICSLLHNRYEKNNIHIFFFLNEMLLLFLCRSIIWYKGRKIKANTIKCVTCSSAPSYQITTRIKTAFLKGSNTLWNPVKFLSHILQSWSGCFLDLALLCWDTHLPTYSLGELWRHLPQC